MKIPLQDFLVARKVGDFDVGTGELSPTADAAAPAPKPRGYYTKLGDQLACLYLASGKLTLRIGDESCPMVDAKTEFSGEGLRSLRIKKGDRVVMKASYPNPVNPPMEFDYSIAEEEDFDFGLFIHNVFSSEKRVRHLVEKWS